MNPLLLSACLSFFSDQTPAFYDGNSVRFRAPDRDQSVFLKIYDEATQSASETELSYESREGKFRYYRAKLPQSSSRKWYRFRIKHGNEVAWWNARGCATTEPSVGDFWIVPGFRVPEWTKHAVHYQIFVDRFRNGNAANDVRDDEYKYEGQPVRRRTWSELPENPGRGRDFFGGDLQGIAEVVPTHLRELGATSLYLNPIFESPSNHKYDTQDYRRVDPHFGGNDALDALVKTTKANGVRLVLDAVFNHTGTWIRWFDRENVHATLGAYESRESQWAKWYHFTEWPKKYEAWWGYSSLPKLNFKNPDVKREIYGLARHWIGKGIDGWRLDVAPDIGEGTGEASNDRVIKELRAAIKAASPEAYFVGEIWTLASDWLEGTKFDAVMNYHGFAEPVARYLTSQLDAKAFEEWITHARAAHPHEINLAMMNLLDSHDTPRFLWKMGGDVRRLKVASALQMTYPGAPMIYYGDEVGLTGNTDPDCRRPFPWDAGKWRKDVFDWYKNWIGLRKRYPALRTGSYLTLLAERRVFSFARFDNSARIAVAINASDEETEVRIPVWRMGSKQDTLTLTLPPWGVELHIEESHEE